MRSGADSISGGTGGYRLSREWYLDKLLNIFIYLISRRIPCLRITLKLP